MACGGGNTPLLSQLKDLVGQIDDCDGNTGRACQSAPCCLPGYEGPFAQVTMTCPPPCLAPTSPQPVKPLQLPCPPCCNGAGTMDEETALNTRYANFYNYNLDWHNDGDNNCGGGNNCCDGAKRNGVTVDGKKPCCEDYTKKPQPCKDAGCPTGFKPCRMKLTPPPGCHPLGVWCAQVQPCPSKPKKKVSMKYEPGPCTRPCCKHWKPKEGPCLYDEPCKAHCYNHPPGIKPRHQA